MAESAASALESVPFLDLRTLHREVSQEILEAWRQILESAGFIGGPHLTEFEEAYASFVGTADCVGLSNGTDALQLALVAMGLKPGDEVITAANTFVATAEAISQAGGRPVFVDVERDSANLDPAKVESAITSRTRVLLPVHLYGQIAELEPLMELARRHDLQVLEDAAQAHGAEYRGKKAGSFGAAASFSFYPGKNLGACGDAGAVTTNDAKLAERLRMLRDHGQSRKYEHQVEGFNARLDALQAAALKIKLPHLDAWNEGRRRCAARYAARLAETALELPVEGADRKHVWHLYVVRHPQRQQILEALKERGVHCGLHYPVPLHLQPAYAELGHREGDFPEAERWAFQGLSLPIFPHMTDEQVNRVCDAMIDVLGSL